MTMCRYCIRCSRQLYLVGTLYYYPLSRLQSAEYLHALAIVGTQGDKLLAIALLIQLQVDEVAALFLGQCRAGQTDDALLCAPQQVGGCRTQR